MGAIDGLFPPFAERLREVEQRAQEAGVLVRWTSGLRTWAEQEALWRQGRDETGNVIEPARIVTNSRPGYSFHNFGLAQDFALVRPAGHSVNWSDTADMDLDGLVDWAEVGKIGEGLGLEWGGRWLKFRDYPHFQWRSRIPLTEVRALYLREPVLAEVWRAVA